MNQVLVFVLVLACPVLVNITERDARYRAVRKRDARKRLARDRDPTHTEDTIQN